VSKSEESITQVATKKTTRKTVTTKQPSRVQKKDAAASKKSIPLVVPLKVSEVKPVSHLAQPVIEKPSEGDHFSLSRFAETIVDGLAMNLGLEKKLLQWLLSDREKLTPTRLAHIDHFMRAAKIHPRVALDDYGTTPMMMAVDHRHRGLIELLQRML
jgi:hypothetical protein